MMLAPSKRERISINMRPWLSTVASYALGFGAAGMSGVVAAGREYESAELATGAFSTVVFGLFSGAILFQHDGSARWSVFAGAAGGSIAYGATWLVWDMTDPGFRHAVPFELLPLIVFPSVIGALVGFVAYFRSLSHAA